MFTKVAGRIRSEFYPRRGSTLRTL